MDRELDRRLSHLEAENKRLSEKTEYLHRMLKETRKTVSAFLLNQIAKADKDKT